MGKLFYVFQNIETRVSQSNSYFWREYWMVLFYYLGSPSIHMADKVGIFWPFKLQYVSVSTIVSTMDSTGSPIHLLHFVWLSKSLRQTCTHQMDELNVYTTCSCPLPVNVFSLKQRYISPFDSPDIKNRKREQKWINLFLHRINQAIVHMPLPTRGRAQKFIPLQDLAQV